MIANLKDFYSSKGSSLNIVYKGEVIQGKDTYLKRLVLQNDKFLLMSGSFEAKKWKRFKRIEISDYFYMSDTYYDAVAFKPKRSIFFLGFGMIQHYEKKEFKLKFKYKIDSTESEEYEVDFS